MPQAQMLLQVVALGCCFSSPFNIAVWSHGFKSTLQVTLSWCSIHHFKLLQFNTTSCKNHHFKSPFRVNNFKMSFQAAALKSSLWVAEVKALLKVVEIFTSSCCFKELLRVTAQVIAWRRCFNQPETIFEVSIPDMYHSLQLSLEYILSLTWPSLQRENNYFNVYVDT